MAKISFVAEVTFKDFFSKCYQIRTEVLVTFTEKILEGKQEHLHWNFFRFSKAVICQKSSDYSEIFCDYFA